MASIFVHDTGQVTIVRLSTVHSGPEFIPAQFV